MSQAKGESEFRVYRGELVDGIAGFIASRGKSPGLVSGGEVQPVLDLQDICRSPYATIGNPVGGSAQQAAVAAENAYIWVSPGINVALEIHQIVVRSTVATGLQLHLLTQAEQTTIGVGAFSRLIRLRQSEPGFATPNFPETTSSVIDVGTNAGIIGATIGRFLVQANIDLVIDLHATPVILYGAQPGSVNIQALAVSAFNVNQSLDATFFGREWPRPGP